MDTEISDYFNTRNPSAIRLAQIEFMKRTDVCEAINVAIGNVELPMHPAMVERMKNLADKDSPFVNGVVKYTPTVGTKEANDAVFNIIESSGFCTDGLYTQITDGGSSAMELVILGACGEFRRLQRPIMLIDPAYTNYISFAQRVKRRVITIQRKLEEDGTFTLADFEEIENKIIEHNPSAIVVIPYDNPTGQFFTNEQMLKIAQLCVKYKMWFISDEAYRELSYSQEKVVSVWGITNKQVADIEGRRISIETVSKVWNACGLRIGAIVTDNKLFHEKAVAEYTTNLCANAIGQYIFGALAHQEHEQMKIWYCKQRDYYKKMIVQTSNELKRILPKIIISRPEASIYSVIDVRNIAKKDFDAKEFVMHCAKNASVDIEGKKMTLLVAPMDGFYDDLTKQKQAKTQMRIAYVQPPEKMKMVPQLFCKLFKDYNEQK